MCPSPRARLPHLLGKMLIFAVLGVACAPRGAGPGTSPAAGAAPAPPGATTAPGAAAQPAPPRKVSFAIAVAVPDQGQPWVFVPQGAGYFAEEGLEVEVLPNDGGGAALKQVATGNADFSVGSAENTLNAVAEGMRLRAFTTVITRSIYDGIVLPDSPVQNYAALRGKQVGVSAFTSGAYPMAQAALSENGIDPKKDVEFVTIGSGGPALDALKTNKVDAVVTTDTQIAIFETLGVKARRLPRPAAGQVPGDQLLTRQEILQRDPDLVARFGRAVLKGIIFAQANPNVAVDYFVAQYPDAARGKTHDEHLLVLKARLDNMELVPEQQGKWGFIPLAGYEEIQRLGLELGTIKARQDLPQIMTNELSDRINTFSPEQVRQQAQAARP
jgi:NitT/TauT family transport system substrate-binding protein